MKKFENIINEIKQAKNIIIFHHIAPDGDALGSALGLRGILKQIRNVEKIDCVITNYVPEVYKFLPDIEQLKKVDNPTLFEKYDLGICVDCASIDRLGDSLELFRRSTKTICIDHHPSNQGFAGINVIDAKAAGTGEMIFDLARAIEAKLTPEIATNLYTAILTDTGGFKFENTSSDTLRKCAELVDAGADSVNIYKNCYEIKSLAMVKLHARVIDQAIITDDHKIVYGVITRKLLNELNATDDCVDGITEALRQIKGVEVAIVFKETLKKTTRASLRSNKIDVSEIAGFFGGGGHKLAAGCLIEKDINEATSDVLSVIKSQLKKQKEYIA